MSNNGFDVLADPDVRRQFAEAFRSAISAKENNEAAKKPAAEPLVLSLDCIRKDPVRTVDRVIAGRETIVFEYSRYEFHERCHEQSQSFTQPVAVLMPFSEYSDLVALRKDVDALAARNAPKA